MLTDDVIAQRTFKFMQRRPLLRVLQLSIAACQEFRVPEGVATCKRPKAPGPQSLFFSTQENRRWRQTISPTVEDLHRRSWSWHCCTSVSQRRFGHSARFPVLSFGIMLCLSPRLPLLLSVVVAACACSWASRPVQPAEVQLSSQQKHSHVAGSCTAEGVQFDSD